MSVSKLRVLYIASVVLLGILLVFTVFRPMVSDREYSEVLQEELLQAEDGWIFQFVILNHEGRDTNYTINALFGGTPYVQEIIIKDGGRFTYTHRVQRSMISEAKVSFDIYKEGADTPFEQTTYYLK